jgi:hypothetical protein
VAVSAPFCNVTVFAPPPGPLSPHGFRLLSPNATLQDVISAFNNNFSPQAQQDEFNRQLRHDLEGPTNVAPKKGSAAQKPSQRQIPKKVDDKIGKIRFRQIAIVRKKIRVENPDDHDQYVIDNRVVSMVMRDKSGALWTFEDKQAAKGISAGNEESTGGEGG